MLYLWRVVVRGVATHMPDEQQFALDRVEQELSSWIAAKRIDASRSDELAVVAASEDEAGRFAGFVTGFAYDERLWLLVRVQHRDGPTARWRTVSEEVAWSDDFPADADAGTDVALGHVLDLSGIARDWGSTHAHVLIDFETEEAAIEFGEWLHDVGVAPRLDGGRLTDRCAQRQGGDGRCGRAREDPSGRSANSCRAAVVLPARLTVRRCSARSLAGSDAATRPSLG